jgi:hypothetical protein
LPVSGGRPPGAAFNAIKPYRRYCPAMRRTADPLARLDPGWLFVIAGLVMCAAAITVPAQSDLLQLRRQLAVLRDEETLLAARLRAHAAFLDDLCEAEPALVRRLAAAQLNLVPEGERPVLMVRSTSASVGDWIESTVRELPIERSERPASLLSRLTEGRQRLWVLGGSVFCVFVGLLLGPATSRPQAERSRPVEAAARGRSEQADEPAVLRRNAAKSAGSMIARPVSRQPLAQPSALLAEPSVVACTSTPVAEAADSCGEAPEADHLLMISDVEDEADVLDEDDPEPAANNDVGEDEPAPGAADPADEPVGEDGAGGPEPTLEGGDDEDDEDDEEWEYEDEIAADAAAAGDDADDDEYEYEYEYVYVDEDEDEAEGGDPGEDEEEED